MSLGLAEINRSKKSDASRGQAGGDRVKGGGWRLEKVESTLLV